MHDEPAPAPAPAPAPPAVDGSAASSVAGDIIAAAPEVSADAGKIEKTLTGVPPADPAAPYGYLKNGKPRKSAPRDKPAAGAGGSLLPDDRTQHRRDAAGGIVDTITATLGAIFDAEEWTPAEGERANLVNAAARYMDAQNLDDLPPGVALVIAAALYAIPRLVVKPKTRGKMSALFGWFAKWKTGK